jgi:hypothetical protein
MSFSLKPRRLLPAAMIAALAAGAATAVLASGAGPEPRLLTLKGGPERLLTIRGSERGDTLTIAGAAPGSVTINADRQFTSSRTDCTVYEPVFTTAFCDSDNLRTIDVGLVEGRDRLRFSEGFDEQPPGMNAIVGRGGAAADDLKGSVLGDDFEGGPGGDRLRGAAGGDDLDGGPAEDDCKGGPGNDHVRRCE